MIDNQLNPPHYGASNLVMPEHSFLGPLDAKAIGPYVPPPTPVREVYRAMLQVARAMSKLGISKDSRNTAQAFNFRGIDDVLNALSTPLVEAELLIIPRVIDRKQTERATKSGGVQYHVALSVEFTFVSARDGSQAHALFVGEAADTADKATSKAMSMAYKYMAFDTFCIPVQGLDDADRDTPEPTIRAVPSKNVTREVVEQLADTLTEESPTPADEILKRIAAAATAKDLGALKQEVATYSKTSRWAEIKTAYSDRYNFLTTTKKAEAA